MNRPVSASVNAGIFERSRRFARSASAAGVVLPRDHRLEQLLEPLDLPATFPGDRGPGPGQIAQLADRLRGHERPADQAVRAELGQPGRVGDVALAARQVLDVPGVDQHDLEPGVLKEVVERLPVVPGGLHHRTGDLLGD